MKTIAAAFPKRSMRIKSTGQPYPALWAIIALLLIAAAGGASFTMGPNIQRDWRISQDAVVAEDGTISGGECKSRRFIFRTCKGRIAYTVNGRRYSKTIDFEYVDIDSSPGVAEVVRSASDPSLATLDVAIEKLWHQVALLALLLVVATAFFIGTVKKMVRASRQRRAVMAFNGKVLRPIPVTITDVTKNGYWSSTVTYVQDGQPSRTFTTGMGRNPEPFYLNDDPDDTSALAVTDEKGETTLLLDKGLTRLDFTDSERAAIRMALRAPAAQAA